MLRHYNEIGLLMPEKTDDFTGYRYYSASQLALAGRITALKDMGFSLASVAEILKSYDNPQALKQYLLLKKTELLEQAEETNRRLLLLENTIKRLGKEGTAMGYSVALKEMPARTVASLRAIIPSYEMEGTLWHKMMSEIMPQKAELANPCYSLAIFHDKEYKERDVDVEIQISVQEAKPDTANVKFKTTAPMQIAAAIFKGSYEKIGEVNEAIANWICDNNYEFNGAMFNIYHVGPATEKNPEEWVTEVCYPVKKQ